MTYEQPKEELLTIAKELLKSSPDNMAFQERAVTQFYFILNAQRIARAYIKAVEND